MLTSIDEAEELYADPEGKNSEKRNDFTTDNKIIFDIFEVAKLFFAYSCSEHKSHNKYLNVGIRQLPVNQKQPKTGS